MITGIISPVRLFSLLGVCAFFISTVPALEMLRAAEPVAVEGIVYASDWDDNGAATAVIIFADQGEYIVSLSGKGRELLKLENKNVRVTGTVRVDEEGEKIITVMDYQMMEGKPAGGEGKFMSGEGED